MLTSSKAFIVDGMTLCSVVRIQGLKTLGLLVCPSDSCYRVEGLELLCLATARLAIRQGFFRQKEKLGDFAPLKARLQVYCQD